MNSPLVSILIPNYNKALYLRETLDSVLSQTYQNWECIIVDDLSTDASWEILEEYKELDTRFHIFKRPFNLSKGANTCRNFAFQLSKGEFINWFDSDDLMFKDFIYKKIVFILKHPKFDCVISRPTSFDNDIKCYENWIPKYENMLVDYLLKDIHFTTPGPLFKRNVLEDVDLFNNEIPVGQEKEFYFRLLVKGMRVFVLDFFSYKYRVSDDSIVSSHIQKNKPYLSLMYKYFIARTIVFDCKNIIVYKSYIIIPLKSFIYSCVVNLKLKYALKAIFILSIYYVRSRKILFLT
ncbi:glycosyltransferase family 2 protein [Algoriphagus chordae]|uniref:Glycosyltransferase involved in cell wall biosynthesis n=1 Tax=Algoriphagus chordae TaxID=237019 RepID=A0A2W7QHB5_9BACT|nr:glycosyltransferase family 2 protein [Algoriphagus chordae]PZX47643.1 glycosyltransferase involved in cell wall biosynthesis [Algoriphagus chordae]